MFLSLHNRYSNNNIFSVYRELQENLVCNLVHDDGALDGKLEVAERVAHDGDDALHAVDLLPQEDVQRLQDAHLLQPRAHLQGTEHTTCVNNIHNNIHLNNRE